MGYNNCIKQHSVVYGEILLGQSAQIEASDNDNNSPLHLAAQSGHSRTVELLLGKGAQISTINNYNNTPLNLAESEGHSWTVELLRREVPNFIKNILHDIHL